MSKSVRTAPPNSLLFISDADGGDTPEITRGSRLWATPTCIAIGCHPFMDGETEVILGASRDVDPKSSPAFEGLLSTPNRIVVVSTVERETLLSATVPNKSTRVKVWTNDPKTPDKVIVGLE
jgi:hypothetical protein